MVQLVILIVVVVTQGYTCENAELQKHTHMSPCITGEI